MPDHFTDENEGEPVAWRHHGPMGGWITTEEKQSWSEQPLYAHPDPAVERLERELNCCQMQLTDAEADRERLQRELDEARGIVRNIYWMACRYADGRNTYAPGMYNRAIAKAYDAGWLTFDHTGRRYEVQYARDGMSPEWKTAEERAISAEASLAKAIAERDEARAKADENWKLAEYERHDANHWHIQFEAATNALKDLTGAFSIYTVEGEDGIRLSTGGKVVANYSEHSEGGIALLRLEARHRAARAILGDQPT